MKRIFIFLIECYQKIPFSCHGQCRFSPTCSEYMKESILTYGVLRGTFLGMKRILRCNPLNSYGYDPVPIKETVK